MTRDDVIRLARKAGFDSHDMSDDFTCNLKDLERFAALVVAEHSKRGVVTIDRGCFERGCSCYDIRTDKDGVTVAAVGNQVITDPAEIRRVFELDDAEPPPPPDSGFVKL